MNWISPFISARESDGSKRAGEVRFGVWKRDPAHCSPKASPCPGDRGSAMLSDFDDHNFSFRTNSLFFDFSCFPTQVIWFFKNDYIDRAVHKVRGFCAITCVGQVVTTLCALIKNVLSSSDVIRKRVAREGIAAHLILVCIWMNKTWISWIIKLCASGLQMRQHFLVCVCVCEGSSQQISMTLGIIFCRHKPPKSWFSFAEFQRNAVVNFFWDFFLR